MDDINLGEKISKYRKQKKLSIKNLADMTKLTPSLLSQIERGLANPSINTLKLISQSLDVPIYRFFIETKANNQNILRNGERKRILFPDNNGFTYELLSPTTDSNIEFIMMKINPGSSSSLSLMSHEGEEVAIVVDGKVKITLSGEEFILDKWDSVKIDPNVYHKWENPFDVPALIVFAVTPPSF